MIAAVIAAFGAAISEVGAVIIAGGNQVGYDQTLASALLAHFNDYGDVPYEIAVGIVLLALILVLIGVLTVLQQRTGGDPAALPDGLRCTSCGKRSAPRCR